MKNSPEACFRAVFHPNPGFCNRGSQPSRCGAFHLPLLAAPGAAGVLPVVSGVDGAVTFDVEVEPLLDVSGAGVAALEGEAGAGVLTGAASLGVLEVGGVTGISSFFLQPASVASTTAVANIVFRINIDSPLSFTNGAFASRTAADC
jgi:hypothetical protein